MTAAKASIRSVLQNNRRPARALELTPAKITPGKNIPGRAGSEAHLVRSRISAIWRYGLAAGSLFLISIGVGAAPGMTSMVKTVSYQVSTSAALGVHVSGNELVNTRHRRVVLHGVDRSGGEWMCVQGTGICDGPMGQPSVTAIKSWGVNAVRVPLNEACWNGESYVNPADRGAAYRRAVEAYVRLLNRNGLIAIVDLALDRRPLHRPLLGAARSAQAPARSRCPTRRRPSRSGPRWPARSRATTRSSSTCSTSPIPQAAAGSEDRRLAVLAARRQRVPRASATRPWPACRRWSTRSARPARTT